jgi:protein-S-isoprenylcysteine O-methyltransferase Ste14
VHLAAKLTLRRSFGVIAANRGVKLSGPYRIVRHPMYLGYMLTQAALIVSGPSLRNCLLVACCWTLQVARILAEERVLRADARYADLMRTTPHRLVPGLF